MPQPLQLRRTFGGGDALQSGDNFTFLRYYPESLPTLSGRMTAEPHIEPGPGAEPRGYDEVKVTWGEVEIPAEVDGVALVRSCFGYATHPDDGQMLMFVRTDPDVEPTSEYLALDLLPDHVVDRAVVPGRWYYYTFMTHSAAGWRSQYTASTVVPVDYRHRETLRDLVPPYYLRLDEEQWAGTPNSVLDRFLYVLGYELDMTRTLAEGIQDLWNPDTAPMQLAESLGQQNLGIGSSELLGDLRFRGVLSDSLMINEMRGTVEGLRRFVEAASKYATDVTLGVNDLLLVDDAEFLTGTGHWAPAPYAVTIEVAGGTAPLPTHRAVLSLSDKRPPAGDGTNAYPNWVRGAVRVSAATPAGEDEQQVVLACGAGQRHEVVAKDADGNETTDLLHMNPGLNGIGVEPGDAYHVSAYFRKDEAADDPSYVVVGMAFFGEDEHESYAFSDAFSTAFDGYSTMSAVGVVPEDWDALPSDELDTTDWVRFEREAVVPDGAKYLVPVVRIGSGQAVDPAQAPPPPVHMTAVTVTRSQGEGLTSVYVPGSIMVLGRDELDTAIIGG